MAQKPKRCMVCEKLFKRLPGETANQFYKRKTCDDPECKELVKSDRETLNHCPSCGAAYWGDGEYCGSWECRLAGIWCKRWGVPISLQTYRERAKLLDTEQFKINLESARRIHVWG